VAETVEIEAAVAEAVAEDATRSLALTNNPVIDPGWKFRYHAQMTRIVRRVESTPRRP